MKKTLAWKEEEASGAGAQGRERAHGGCGPRGGSEAMVQSHADDGKGFGDIPRTMRSHWRVLLKTSRRMDCRRNKSRKTTRAATTVVQEREDDSSQYLCILLQKVSFKRAMYMFLACASTNELQWAGYYSHFKEKERFP